MTREKISEHAALVVMAVFRNPDQPGGAILAEATDLLTNFRRATLQEAARAVCNVCRVGTVPPVKDGEDWYHDTPTGSIWCGAGEIHDLIAALNREGDHE